MFKKAEGEHHVYTVYSTKQKSFLIKKPHRILIIHLSSYPVKVQPKLKDPGRKGQTLITKCKSYLRRGEKNH